MFEHLYDQRCDRQRRDEAKKVVWSNIDSRTREETIKTHFFASLALKGFWYMKGYFTILPRVGENSSYMVYLESGRSQLPGLSWYLFWCRWFFISAPRTHTYVRTYIQTDIHARRHIRTYVRTYIQTSMALLTSTKYGSVTLLTLT